MKPQTNLFLYQRDFQLLFEEQENKCKFKGKNLKCI